MYEGGYTIIDFLGVDLTNLVNIKGIYNKIKTTKKAVMISNLLDPFTNNMFGNNYATTTFNVVENRIYLDFMTNEFKYFINIDENDNVSITRSEIGSGSGGYYNLVATDESAFTEFTQEDIKKTLKRYTSENDKAIYTIFSTGTMTINGFITVEYDDAAGFIFIFKINGYTMNIYSNDEFETFYTDDTFETIKEDNFKFIQQ